jgi:hypothetical protein
MPITIKGGSEHMPEAFDGARDQRTRHVVARRGLCDPQRQRRENRSATVAGSASPPSREARDTRILQAAEKIMLDTPGARAYWIASSRKLAAERWLTVSTKEYSARQKKLLDKKRALSKLLLLLRAKFLRSLKTEQ